MLMLTSAATSTDKQVSPKRWASSFCNVLTGYADNMKSVNSDIEDTTKNVESAVTSDPTKVFDYIAELADEVGHAAKISARAADKVRALPRPQVGGGTILKRSLSRALGGGLDDIAAQFRKAESEFERIPKETTDPTTAALRLASAASDAESALEGVGSTISSSLENLNAKNIDPKHLLARALKAAHACAPVFG